MFVATACKRNSQDCKSVVSVILDLLFVIMAIDLTEAKDWIYAICTGIQTLLAIFGLLFVSYWWDRKKRKEDRKEAKLKADEETQKWHTEKIIAILSENYDEVEKKFRILQKHVHDLKKGKIATESRTFTEFDVLLYMCHRDNRDTFDKTHQLDTNKNAPSTGYGREDIMSHVREIMGFFKNFSFELIAIDKTCPNSIKLEFSTEIIEMGKTIYPFVTNTRQKLIEKVLIYFGYSESEKKPNTSTDKQGPPSSIRCFPCRRTESKDHRPDGPTSTLGTSHAINMEMTIAAPSASQNGNEGLKAYSGHYETKRAIPYIETLRYENGEMTCDLSCTFSCIKELEICVQKRKIEQCTKVAISKEIKSLWLQSGGSDLQGDLLHLIRMVMFKLSNDPKFFQEKLLGSFVDYVNSAIPVNKEVVHCGCERALQDIEFHIGYLRQNRVRHLMEDKRTWVFLQQHVKGLRKFVYMITNHYDRPEQVQTNRSFSSP